MLFSAMMSAGILATSLLGWLVNNNTIDLIIASILDYWLLLLRFDQIDVEIWSATKKKQRRLELFCGSLNLRAYFLAFGRVLFSIGCDDRTGAGFRPSAPFSLCWFSSESSSCRTRHTFQSNKVFLFVVLLFFSKSKIARKLQSMTAFFSPSRRHTQIDATSKRERITQTIIYQSCL